MRGDVVRGRKGRFISSPSACFHRKLCVVVLIFDLAVSHKSGYRIRASHVDDSPSILRFWCQLL